MIEHQHQRDRPQDKCVAHGDIEPAAVMVNHPFIRLSFDFGNKILTLRSFFNIQFMQSAVVTVDCVFIF